MLSGELIWEGVRHAGIKHAQVLHKWILKNADMVKNMWRGATHKIDK